MTVQPDGYITMTLGGDAKIVGLTLPEATALINRNAQVRLKEANAQPTLTDFQHPYFVVAGEVNSPNRYELRQDMTALQALMFAGGSRITGKDTQVVLIQHADEPHPIVRVLDLKKMTVGAVADVPHIGSGDIVFVPRNKITNAQQITALITPLASYGVSATTIAYP